MSFFQRLTWLGLWLGVAGSSACSSETDGGPNPIAGTGVRLETVASGLGFPLYLTAPPGDLNRLFIVEKTGAIRIIKDGTLLPDPFLDLSGQVSGAGEQGLLGLAFDPQYASNGRFFVHYTIQNDDNQVSQFQVSSDPDRADPGSGQVILSVHRDFTNHNGGQLTFGPDGFLYLGLGDGGGSSDPMNRGQSLTDLLGSILRLDVQAGSSYTIPADNPFVGQAGAQPEIWSYGLRNPWRFSFDRATGDLYIADVGEARFEEIDVAPAADGGGRGANYGWSLMEGAHCFASQPCDQEGLIPPVYAYSHDTGCSVTGGYVYRGSLIPALQGHYLFADFCQGWVRSFRYADGAATELSDWPALRTGGMITSFGEDAAGELYVLDSGGGVYKVVPEP